MSLTTTSILKVLIPFHHANESFAVIVERLKKNKNMLWVAAKDFTVEVGKEQIVQFIQTWQLNPRWIYSLDFLYWTEEEDLTSYHYLANFSTPSPQMPIPTAAGVYFVMDVSRVGSQTEPIDVHYVVESNRLKHTPRGTEFTEKWLLDIIESKIALSQAMRNLCCESSC